MSAVSDFFLSNHLWIAAESFVVGLVLRLLKEDSVLPTIPARWRAFSALVLGVLTIVLNKKAAGMTWTEAATAGLSAAALAVVGHDTLVEGLRRGKEVPIPKLLKKPNSEGPDTQDIENDVS